MATNEKTDYKARELKSVHVDAIGQFIKLLVHKNHVNKLNLFNQVSGFLEKNFEIVYLYGVM